MTAANRDAWVSLEIVKNGELIGLPGAAASCALYAEHLATKRHRIVAIASEGALHHLGELEPSNASLERVKTAPVAAAHLAHAPAVAAHAFELVFELPHALLKHPDALLLRFKVLELEPHLTAANGGVGGHTG